ncbi:MAG: dephospho-CoA kinase [Bacteroidetes bacterium]|nr:MAG: dephospho-CoA kinase [Bacteroidota bacterium]TAG94112.1 MAG: dephospho-CoA kinase [Bacteroidota bacterium]
MANIIGITGGIGSGKSIVCKVFALLGVPIYEADLRARYLMNHNPTIKEKLKNVFGDKTYNENNELDRRFLAENVFIDNQKVLLLNSIVHPEVAKDFKNWIDSHQHFEYVLNEAALMFESGSYQRMDKVITVFSPLELRKQRIKARDLQRTDQEIDNIIQKQLPEEEKLKRADFIIENDNQKLLLPQILKLDNFFRLQNQL